MTNPKLYCAVCKKHTPHCHLVAQLATQCQLCFTITGQLERAHAESFTYAARDNDGSLIQGQVVHNSPDNVSFYVAKGKHAGYYHYDKQQRRQIEN